MRVMQDLISRTRVYLNGVGLTDLDPSIVIRDVSYGTPAVETQTVARARTNGGRVTRQRYESATVDVSFEIHEPDPLVRQEIASRAAAWAMAGGILTTDDRAGKRLRVVCTTPPAIESATRWTGTLQAGFTAFALPFWEDEQPFAYETTDGSATLYGAGNAADPFVTAKVTAAAAVTSVTLTAGSTTFALTGLSLSSGQHLIVDYDAAQTLRIYVQETGTSCLAARSAASSDDLTIPRGASSTATMTADGSASAVFYVRGLYI